MSFWLKFLFCVFLPFTTCLQAQNEPELVDVVVYGGTSAGVIAAVQLRQLGHSVVLIEPGQHLGGLSSGGLGATDIGNKRAIGGLAREFYRRIKRHYQQESSWKFEQPTDFKRGTHLSDEDAMWYFEPHVAEQIFNDFIREHEIEVIRNAPLRESDSVRMSGLRIESIYLSNGKSFAAKCFIDSSYEGDLMAAAKVSYTVGREANETYGETLNGVQVQHAVKHQLQPGLDPFVRPGDPSSGVLFGIEAGPPPADGTSDHRVQAYNLRLCVTDIESNRIPFSKPAGYDESRYELLFRNLDAGENREPWNPIMMPNRKTDANNNFGFSTDYIGQSYQWADAIDSSRRQIYAQHLNYTQGLMWTLANHPRVPEKMREKFARWGLCKDEFSDNAGWSHQLYVREARRMQSDLVMNQNHCQGREVVTDAIGLAAYTMDSHNVQRYVGADGFVHNEGDVEVGGFPPYPISYRSIVPARKECTNLFVPVCLSASHIAFGSIRMEPVFMVLGQTTAIAAHIAMNDDVSVQEVPYDKLRKSLLEHEQILDWR